MAQKKPNKIDRLYSKLKSGSTMTCKQMKKIEIKNPTATIYHLRNKLGDNEAIATILPGEEKNTVTRFRYVRA